MSMPSLLSRHQHDATTSHRHLSILLLTTSILAYLGTPVQHSLLTNAIAWIAICAYSNLRARGKKRLSGGLAQRLSWCAGGLLAVAQLCQRAAEGRGILWANCLLPALVYLCIRSEIISIDADPRSPPPSPDKARAPQSPTSPSHRITVLILTGAAVAATFSAFGSNALIALGLSCGLINALALLLIEKAGVEAQVGRQNGGSIIYSANGLLTQPSKPARSDLDVQFAVIGDVSLIAAAATTMSAFTFETFAFGGLAYWGVIGQVMGEKWLLWQGLVGVIFAVLIVSVHVVLFWSLMMMIQRQGSMLTSIVPLWAAVFSQLILDFSISRLWFAALCTAWMFVFFDERDTSSGLSPRRPRFHWTLIVVAVISFVALFVAYLREPYERVRSNLTPNEPFSDVLQPLPPVEPLAPAALDNTHEHPVSQLVHSAGASWQQVLSGQSQSLEAAVAEYKRRYGIPPPPHFDKWYELAKRKNVQMIDEYDTIYRTMLPFWGVSPATIRARAREAIGYSDNMLMGLALRDGQASVVTGGPDWLQQAAVGMIEDFVQYLPDMDLAFNTHDEPRVVVPHDDLSRLVQTALKENMPPAIQNAAPRNTFSARPSDLNDGKRFAECRTTRFNWYAHQPVWDPSRLSCAPDTPARALDEAFAADNLTSYALGELGFVYNETAFSDICNSPSLSTTFGFFDRPNAFNTVHDLFPIFSQSKISSFQDILYPSPWYWYGKVPYQEWSDVDWIKKVPKLLWRGSTTGGFSRDGGWRRQHRQHMVQKLNALDDAKILLNKHPSSKAGSADWQVTKAPRQDYKDLMDVHFSHVGQCDPGDCAAQKEFFEIADGIEQQDHWKWRFLLDMDGNAFSGRFYAFLKSRSLVLKMAIFREWHQEWLKPWVHFIPLSLRGDEVLESVRFFSSAAEGGEDLAKKVAEEGRDWANKALRNEDIEVWLFRLLLEYGRVIDDNRAEIGYSGP